MTDTRAAIAQDLRSLGVNIGSAGVVFAALDPSKNRVPGYWVMAGGLALWIVGLMIAR